MICDKCGSDAIEFNVSQGKILCTFCGLMIEDHLANPELLFDNSNVQKKGTIHGSFLKNVSPGSLNPTNRNTEIILSSARRKIHQFGNALKLKSSYQEEAYRFFVFAFQRGFVPAHKFESVCISCLYVVCRRKKTPHLLVDFSDLTQIQTYKIGGIFLKFIRIFHVHLPVADPSLFVYRFISRLKIGNKFECIARSSFRLIARMKREWMNSGRRPAGLCGAAILLAAKMHGIQKTQKEIGEIARIGDMALRTRLREMETTSMANLTLAQVDGGGGDDGDRHSLLDCIDLYRKDPPSFHKISKNKAFELHLEGGEKARTHKANRKKKKSCSCLKTKTKTAEPMELQNGEFYFPSNLNSTDPVRKKKPGTLFFSAKRFFVYFNSAYEVFIKKNLWNELNIQFLHAHTIVTRAQKEKPFAYFRMKDSDKKK
ncbi:TFIIB related factor hBRF (nucleomorph) [Chroomonas mesostigmatica CCMP1168]|uniref:TFIIB related factor hBRF n=1 Tax=Chroomonas mesostigmatica CCMP1168 TaxID=1195612 RepID=J7GA64_9CRYP|nr:TFIIB related factor hBRF [Chroomonas mesostigmatica CCMP1168]AFP65372.1 TFIIB related factor hBRF [Chroomonas mesostigmatica CCMP1168]AFP65375.1 TFIIB related factor hBRF [Chroomonas mesostigmatica CCMP1168]AFP65544.1 TFIIB related factor hBRF [Chroomonas mesostigmatica CCMP1168]AFP65547.1 TFIIB related factor hBRF [Chroomonas mesostigmatica CCMP1168]